MPYPKPQASVSAYKLWTAFFAMLCAAIASFPYFFNPLKNPLYAAIGFLGPYCSTMLMLNWEVLIKMSVKGVLGLWIGIANACLVHVIADAADPGQWNRVWSFLLWLPEAWFWSLAFKPMNNKLRDWIMPEGIFVTGTLGAMFYPPGNVYVALAAAGTWATFGFVVMCSVVTILKVTKLLPHSGPGPISAFADAAANVFEQESGRFPDVNMGADVAEAYHKDLEQAVEKLVNIPLPPKVQATAFTITSELASLRDCLSEGEFSEGMIKYVWKPFCADFSNLRITVSQVLRDCANGKAEASSYDLSEQAKHCQEYLLECIAESNAECARGHTQFPSAAELLRFHYAVGTMLYVAILTENFRKALVEEVIEETKQKKLQSQETAGMATVRISKKIWKAAVNWWKKPFWLDNEGTYSFWDRYQYAIRQQVCYFIIAFPLVIGTAYSNNVAFHGFWSIIPTFVCFMPTAGATLVKGNYRIIGTFLGACMALACVAINPHNKPAWFCELLLLMFSAKLVSLYEPIWYAGWMYSLTWHIVGFTSVQAPLSDDVMLKQAGWRFIFTFGGTLATSFIAATFFPDMACKKLNKLSAETMLKISKKVSKSLDDMVRTKSGLSDTVAGKFVTQSSGAMYAEEDILDTSVFQNIVRMHALAADAKPEVIVYSKIPHAVPKVSKEVLRNQEAIKTVLTYSINLYNSALVTSLVSHPILSDTESYNRFARILHPMWEKIAEFSEALRVSATRISERLASQNEVDDLEGMPDDVHVTIQQFIDKFLDIRERFVAAMLERGDIPASLRTEQCFELYHTFYALGKFAEKWNNLEGSLLHREPSAGELTTLAAIDAAEKNKSRPALVGESEDMTSVESYSSMTESSD
ncbi:hypothetical protein FOL47_006791 [Perkinsus chesapeaki]|uniref:Aluminum-activated malate transporter 1 n=1 Tax=Perkinsus chesapeaki TaxID=330153 RepID=A0A7J6LPF0_PERCH|nr:hypothetical protein FOL47_006791 [Perkinsus chesapeaki]